MDAGALSTSAVLALFLVPVVSLIKRPGWSQQAKYLLGLGAAFLAALGGAFVDGDVTGANFLAYVSTAFTSAQTLYRLYFENTTLETKLESR